MQFFIQPDSELPPSTQLFDQLSFAITSRRYPAGSQLPSIRQLAQWTGLHRNTISKVYQQLKRSGLAESRGGAGMFVPAARPPAHNPLQAIVHQTLDTLMQQGFTLTQVREALLTELDWRAQCSGEVLVVSGQEDPGVAQIMMKELAQHLTIPIQMAAIEELPELLAHSQTRTIVTNRYFGAQTQRMLDRCGQQVRLFLLDIADYAPEIAHIQKLPFGTRLGLLSPSTGILRIAENIVHSLRGEDLVVMTSLPQDTYRLQSMARSADWIIVGHGGEVELERAIQLTRRERRYPVQILVSQNYISLASIHALKVELNLP
jgi:GntR family transcriptional regulator